MNNRPDFPPLGELIGEINRQIEEYPERYSLDEYKFVMERRRQTHKRRGNQFIRFEANHKQFALPLKLALEIMPAPEITPLPNLPEWLMGICNVRGEIVSVVQLAQLLRMESVSAGLNSYLILLQIGQIKTGLLVDKIGGIFFDGDPDQKYKKTASQDKRLSQFGNRAFLSDQYEIHLLEAAKLLPVLTAMS